VHVSVKPYPNGDSNAPWHFGASEDNVTPDDIKDIAAAVWASPSGRDMEGDGITHTTRGMVVQRLNHAVNLSGLSADVDQIKAEVAALVSALATGAPGASAEAIAIAVSDEIDRRMGRHD
jgi:hypothetical protein